MLSERVIGERNSVIIDTASNIHGEMQDPSEDSLGGASALAGGF
jgi:hypothetical protein